MIYLDNAATTYHKPSKVSEAVYTALKNGLGNDGRGVHLGALAASSVILQTRMKLAKLFSLPHPENIVFTHNATEALNIALLGSIGEGDHVISTDFEHNSVLRPLYLLQKEKQVDLDFLPANPSGVLQYSHLEGLLRPSTRALVVNHASNVTGNVADLALFSQFAHDNDLLLIVDASQTAGSFSIDIEELGIDILCFTGHKGLYGPMGTGGLAVRKGIEIRPLKVGGSGVQSFNKDHPAEMPTRLEAGTMNAHGIIGLSAALDWIFETSSEKIRAHEITLMRLFYNSLVDYEEVTIYGDFSSDNRAPIVSLNLGDEDAGTISDILSTEYGIATRPGAHCAPRMHQALDTVNRGTVRFSFSYFNTEAEVIQAVSAIKQIIGTN